MEDAEDRVRYQCCKRKGMTMAKRAVIDADDCAACGTCVEICPEVFSIEEDADTAEFIKEGSAPEKLIQEAMDSCPVECIHWEE